MLRLCRPGRGPLSSSGQGPGPGQVRARKVRFGPEQYHIFGFHQKRDKLDPEFQWVWDALCDFIAETQCSFSMIASNAFKMLSTKLFYVFDDLVSKLFLHLLFAALTR